ncbi:MAG TPA: M20/M25/M40 family metallo-hydrolase [Gemmatimonadales bacterium]|jgi:acetylornithine deacetylase|nr:M20/M25/M40 family metallo-hydrolase [Gemmatimonadales bacterium]
MPSKDAILARIVPDEVIALAKDLVNIPSYTTDESDVARFLHAFFQREGLTSELQEVDPGRFQTIARLPGSGGGRSLMLNGHLDIDPIPSGWVRDPWTPTIEGDRFYGAGIYNMKGGVAAMVMGAVAARRAGSLRGDVLVACVDGELQGGVGTVHMLRRGVRAQMAIVPEPYSTKHIITKHTGVMEFAVQVRGRSVHISRMELGVNAIVKAARVVQALETLRITGEPDPDLPGLPRMNIGTIVGGRGEGLELRGANIVPDACMIVLDVRFPQSVTPDSILGDIRRVLDSLMRADKDLTYEIEFPMRPERRQFREVMLPVSVPATEPIVQILKANVTAVTGHEPTVGAVSPYSYAGNDTAHLWRAGIPCCLYGPAGGSDEGRSDRWTSVEQIVTCARVFGATIADVCG